MARRRLSIGGQLWLWRDFDGVGIGVGTAASAIGQQVTMQIHLPSGKISQPVAR